MNSPGLNGFGTFFRAGRAGTFCLVIFTSPGIWKTPFPLLLMFLRISSVSASMTELTCFRDKPVASATLLSTSLFEGALAEGFLAAVVVDGAFDITAQSSLR